MLGWLFTLLRFWHLRKAPPEQRARELDPEIDELHRWQHEVANRLTALKARRQLQRRQYGRAEPEG
jgi:hypothetical protein